MRIRNLHILEYDSLILNPLTIGYAITNFYNNWEQTENRFLIIKRKMIGKNFKKHPRDEKVQRSFKDIVHV
jgi:hypothetical protein